MITIDPSNHIEIEGKHILNPTVCVDEVKNSDESLCSYEETKNVRSSKKIDHDH
jgi:hypothetical protein